MKRGILVLGLVMILLATGQAFEGEWNVNVKSQLDYNYKIEGNKLVLTIFVNATLKNSCEAISAEAVPLMHPNSYEVVISRTTAPGAMCLQVIKEVGSIDVDIPLSSATNSVSITVKKEDAGKSIPKMPGMPRVEKGAKSRDCDELKDTLRKVEEQKKECENNPEECTVEKLEGIQKQLVELNKKFENECGATSIAQKYGDKEEARNVDNATKMERAEECKKLEKELKEERKKYEDCFRNLDTCNWKDSFKRVTKLDMEYRIKCVERIRVESAECTELEKEVVEANEKFRECLKNRNTCNLEDARKIVSEVSSKYEAKCIIPAECEKLEKELKETREKYEECKNNPRMCDEVIKLLAKLDVEYKNKCAGLNKEKGGKAKKVVEKERAMEIIGAENVEIIKKTELRKEGNKTVSIASGKKVVALNEILPKVKNTVKKIEKVEVDDDGTAPVYRVKGYEEGKLLWIFPITVPVSVEVDASGGKVAEVRKPWWSFLVFR